MRQAARGGLVLLMLLVTATAGRAQTLGTVAGSVKDTSGAVLPGVTAEVASLRSSRKPHPHRRR
jgi:hypothetical protein